MIFILIFLTTFKNYYFLLTAKQIIISRSSAEVEYRAMATVVCELLWVSYLLKDFQIIVKQSIPLLCDKKASLYISANLIFHKLIEYLDIDCHHMRDQF